MIKIATFLFQVHTRNLQKKKKNTIILSNAVAILQNGSRTGTHISTEGKLCAGLSHIIRNNISHVTVNDVGIRVMTIEMSNLEAI